MPDDERPTRGAVPPPVQGAAVLTQQIAVEQPDQRRRVHPFVCPLEFGEQAVAPVVGERHTSDRRCPVTEPPRVEWVPGQLTLDDALPPAEQLPLWDPPADTTAPPPDDPDGGAT